MPATRLSGREKEVAALLREGLRSKSIAARMQVRDTTVRTFIARMRRKAGLTGRSLHALVLQLQREAERQQNDDTAQMDRAVAQS